MRLILNSSSFYFLGAVIFIGVALLFLFSFLSSDGNERIMATAELGTVQETVSISGVVEAKNAADLAFPVVGKVTGVYMEEGDEVAAGDVLATIGSASLVAQKNEAVAKLKLARAQYEETINGNTREEIEVANTKVQNAEAALQQTIIEEEQKVQNARRDLLSNQLEAISTDANEDAVAPTISGTYNCEQEGVYFIDFYESGARSGYSYNLSGLEKETASAYVNQPSTIGTCGLLMQIDSGGHYGNSSWRIDIPNTHASNYTTYKSAYDLAIKQRDNKIAAAEDALKLAKDQANITTATTRPEVIAQKKAAVEQAQAQISSIDAQLADHSIVAPFAGFVTDVSILVGETATTKPVITLLSTDTFELTARVPEIDITKIAVGQTAEIVFDANTSETLTGTISYISPLATEIDGVAYFETTITLNDPPAWLRAGLNADIDIMTKQVDGVIKLPKRFISSNADGTKYVDKLVEGKIQTTPVTITATGNDGWVALTGLNEGDTVVAPEQK